MNQLSETKFLLFTLEFPPLKGGVTTLYQNYADHWSAGKLFVLADDVLKVADRGSIKYRHLTGKLVRPRWLPAFFQLWSELDRLGKNTHVLVGQILPLGIAAYYLSRILKFRYTVFLHGLDFTLAIASKRRKKITDRILLAADNIICTNSYTANSVKVFNPDLAAKLVMINPGIEPSFIRDTGRVQELKRQYGLENKKVLLGLGRLVRRKGVDKVIEAMSTIVSSAPQTVYVIAGGGPEAESYRELVNSLPPDVKGNIIFLGQISDADRWAWLELCDIFIMASRNIAGDYEGFGIVYLEANLAGKPVIAGDSGGVRDVVINNINGLLVNPENPTEIAAAVLELINDPVKCRELGEQGNRRAVENFNADKVAEKIYQVLIR